MYLLRHLLAFLGDAALAASTAGWSLLHTHMILVLALKPTAQKPIEPIKASAGSKARYVLFLEALWMECD